MQKPKRQSQTKLGSKGDHSILKLRYYENVRYSKDLAKQRLIVVAAKEVAVVNLDQYSQDEETGGAGQRQTNASSQDERK